jgi:hypothetical protein
MSSSPAKKQAADGRRGVYRIGLVIVKLGQITAVFANRQSDGTIDVGISRGSADSVLFSTTKPEFATRALDAWVDFENERASEQEFIYRLDDLWDASLLENAPVTAPQNIVAPSSPVLDLSRQKTAR